MGGDAGLPEGLGEEVAGDEAELLGTTGRRGGGGGYGNGERWRRLRSGALGEERTREEGEREGGEKDRGGCVATFRTSRRRGGGQAGRCRGGTAVRTRRPHAPGLLAGGGGRLALASRLGRPAGPHSARPQVSTGRRFSNFVFFSTFLAFVWFNKNTKPFYLLMPIFVGANGIIPELLYKWHNFLEIY